MDATSLTMLTLQAATFFGPIRLGLASVGMPTGAACLDRAGFRGIDRENGCSEAVGQAAR